jgi:hypothetical protein
MNNRKNKLLAITITLYSVMVIISCSHSGNTAPAISFSKQIIPILTGNCATNSSCHLGASSLNLETNFDSSAAYTTIITKKLVNTGDPSASLLYVEVQGNGTAEMPKPPLAALSAAQQAEILEWIKQGAQNN